MDDAVIKRIMPHSSEAEQSVIGSMLIDNDTISIAAERLTAEDFINISTALFLMPLFHYTIPMYPLISLPYKTN